MRRRHTRARLLKASHITSTAGFLILAAGFSYFEFSTERHDELRGLFIALLGMAVVVTGVLGDAMCRIAAASIGPKLAADLLEHAEATPVKRLQLVAGEQHLPRHRHR